MVRDWFELPVVLHVEDLAELKGWKVSTVLKYCQRKTMVPAPNSWSRPYEWSRAAVQRHFDGPRPSPAKVIRHRPQRVRSAHRIARDVGSESKRLLELANGGRQ